MAKWIWINGVKYRPCGCPDCSPSKVKRVVRQLVKKALSKRGRQGAIARNKALSPDRRKQISAVANAAKRARR